MIGHRRLAAGCAARGRLTGLSRPGVALVAGLLCFTPGRVPATAAETVGVDAGLHGNYARLAFHWGSPASCQASVAGNVVTLRFSRPFDASLDAIPRRLPDYVERIAFGADHSTVVVTLKRPVSAETFGFGSTVAVDLHPQTAAAARMAPPAASVPRAAVPEALPVVPPAAAGISPTSISPTSILAKGIPLPPAPTAAVPAPPAAATVAAPPRPISASPTVQDGIRLSSEGGKGRPRLIAESQGPVDFRLSRSGQDVTITFPRPLTDAEGLEAIASLKPRVSANAVTLTLPVGSELERSGAGHRIVLTPVGGRLPAEPKVTEAKPGPAEPRQAEPQQAKPQQAEAQQAEPQQAEPKAPVVKPAVVKPAEPSAMEVAKPAPTTEPAPVTPAVDRRNPVALSIAKRRDGSSQLVLSSRKPFALDMAQAGRDVTLTLPRLLALPSDLSSISALNPRSSPTTLVLTLADGEKLERSERNGRVILDLTKTAATEPQPGMPLLPPATLPISPAPSVRAAPAPSAPAPAKPAPAIPAASAAVQSATAEPGGPLVVPARVRRDQLTDGGSLRFSPAPTAAAVFRRGRYLWVAFAGTGSPDLSEARQGGASFTTAADQVPAQGGTVLRFQITESLAPVLRRGEGELIVDLLPQPERADTPIVSQSKDAPARLRFDVVPASPPIIVADPSVGDGLIIVPIREAGQGVVYRQDLIDVQVLPTVQGLAFVPRSDGVKIATLPDAVEVTSGQGLQVSLDVPDRQFRARRDRIFDPAAWAGDGDALARRRALEQAVLTAKPESRTVPRIALARFFLGIGYGPEARGVLAQIETDDPDALRDPSVRALRGVAALLSGDIDAAAVDLATPLIEGDSDLELWRGDLLAERGDLKGAVAAFQHGVPVLPTYPKVLRTRLALAASEARLSNGVDDGGLVAKVLRDDPDPGPRMMALYLQGKEMALRGDTDGALKVWAQVVAGSDRPSRAHALRAETELELSTGKIDRGAAIAALDGLRFAWRGGDFEFALLRRIGELKIADGDYRGGLGTLREALITQPKHRDVPAVQKELADAFAGVFLGPDAAHVPAIRALAVYEENRDLMPPDEKGDEITRKLADRLAAVDLLDRAAALLEGQAKNRLTGVEKAKVVTRIALLRLLDRKPSAALAALDMPVDKDLPAELATQRTELRSRALLELGKASDSLAALDGDDSRNADQLRAEIAIKSQNWTEAAKVFAKLAGDQPADTPLSDEAAHLIMNQAVALTLAGDHDGIATLRGKYEAAMAKTPLGDGFRIVAGADTSGAASMRELTNRLAQVSDLQTFMTNYRKMVQRESLSAVN